MAKRVMRPSRTVEAAVRLMTVLRSYDLSPLPETSAVCGVVVMMVSVFTAMVGVPAGVVGIFAGFCISVLSGVPLLLLAVTDRLLDVLPDVLARLRRIRPELLDMSDLVEAYRRNPRLADRRPRSMMWEFFRMSPDGEFQGRFLSRLSDRVVTAVDGAFGPEVGALLAQAGREHLGGFSASGVPIAKVAGLARELGHESSTLLLELAFSAPISGGAADGDDGPVLRRFLAAGEAFLTLAPRQRRVMMRLMPGWSSDVDDLVAASVGLT